MSSLLSRVTTTAQALPSRVFLYAREKFGKSSLFAHAPGAVFFMTRGETGLVELIAGNRVPPTAHFPYDEADPPTWNTLRQAVRELIDADHSYRAFVIDTANGAEILCQEHVRTTQFNGSQAKFASYGRGWDACRVEWLRLLQDLDHLRAKRKMSVVLLAHTQVKKFDDPTAEESYDKYRPACQDKLWDLTHKWADVICFGHFEADTYETETGKTKARQQVRRVLCFDQSPTWDAGNRYGVTGKIDVGGGAAKGFRAFAKAIADAKATTAPPPAAPAAPPAREPSPPASFAPASPEPEPEAANRESVPAEPEPPQAEPTRPMPAADRRTAAEPRVGGAMVKVLIGLMGEAGIDWPTIREGAGVAAGVPAACGFVPAPDLKIGGLSAYAGLKLRTWLDERKAEKDARKRKSAPRAEEAGVSP